MLRGKHLTNYDCFFFYNTFYHELKNLTSVMKFLLADIFDFFSSKRQCLPNVRIYDVNSPARYDLESKLVDLCDKNR